MPMLSSKCREAKSIAAFHFAMEAAIKKDQQKLEILQEIKAIQALKEVASSPDEVAAKFASEALTIIGEEVPYKLSQQVPCWSVSDVQYWVEKVSDFSLLHSSAFRSASAPSRSSSRATWWTATCCCCSPRRSWRRT